jgi:hypothetical protein
MLLVTVAPQRGGAIVIARIAVVLVICVVALISIPVQPVVAQDAAARSPTLPAEPRPPVRFEVRPSSPAPAPDSPGGNQIRVSALADAAYALVSERVRAGQETFAVYQDADSSLNHGFPSGLFGNPVAIQINGACIDDAAAPGGCSTDPARLDRSRGTVLALTFGPRGSGQFHGLNIEEPQNWGVTQTGNGYDLRSATMLKLDARSPQSIRVQFGVDDGLTGFVTIPPTWTTLTFRFGSEVPSPANPGNVHKLLTIVTNDVNAPGGGTLLLDNIRFEPVPGAQRLTPGLPLSTQTFGVIPTTVRPTPPDQIPPDQLNRNLAAIYEAALAITALLDRGTSDDLADARRIADALSYALRHENQGDRLPTAPDGSGGLHSAYEGGDLPLRNSQGAGAGQAGDARLAGFVAGTALCGTTAFCLVLDGATGGNNAFAILALLTAANRLNEPTYLNDALTIGRWVEATLRDRSATSYGGYFLGFRDGGTPTVRNEGKSVENNADLFAAFSGLAQAEAMRGNAGEAAAWAERAQWAGDFVMRMYDAPTGRFNAGTVPAGTPAGAGIVLDTGHQIGSDVLNIYEFLDADTFVTLALAASPRYRSVIDWRRPVQHARTTFAQTVSAGGRSYSGFSLVTSPVSGPNGVAWEFTGQMIVAMRLVDALYRETSFAADAAVILAQVQQAQAFAPFADGRGLVAATLPNGDLLPPAKQCLDTPSQCIPERVGLAATTWALFAERNLNPLAVGSQWLGCVARPNVGIPGTSGGAGVLQAVLAARPLGEIANNVLLGAVRFPGGLNATVEIDGVVHALPYAHPLPPEGLTQLPFTVRRVTAGQAFRVDVVATDRCGDWRTFLGAGTGFP